MIAIDSNVLIAAHRGEHPLHAVALTRLVETAEGDLPWALPIFCLGEFLRVVTHPRVFSPPSTLEVAIEFIEQLVRSPSMRLLGAGPGYWNHLCAAVMAAKATGNLVFDAQIAAVCIEHGIERILTEDRDFARFTQLHVERLVS